MKVFHLISTTRTYIYTHTHIKIDQTLCSDKRQQQKITNNSNPA